MFDWNDSFMRTIPEDIDVHMARVFGKEHVMAENEQPAFVVTDMATGHKYEIFASGHTRGFDHLTQGVVFNRIPALVSQALADSVVEEHLVGISDDAIEASARLVEGLGAAGVGYREIAADLRALKKGKSLLEDAA